MTASSIVDHLQDVSRELDILIRDAQLPQRGRQDDVYAALQARVRGLAASMVAPLEPRHRSAAPLHFETDGKRSSAWFGHDHGAAR